MMRRALLFLVASLAVCASAEITEMRNGLPFVRDGFGVRRNFYLSGRLSVECSDIGGVYRVSYVGRQSHRARDFYAANENCTFGRFLAPQVYIGERRYRLTFENTVHYPFGYSSECTLEDVKLRHELVLDRNAIFRRITVLENPSAKPVRALVSQMNCFMKGAKLLMNDRRDGLVASRTDGDAVTTIEVGSLNPAHFPLNDRPENPLAFEAKEGNVMTIRCDYVERAPAKEHLFWMVFNRAEGEKLDSARVDAVYAAFECLRKGDAKIRFADEVTDGFVNGISSWFDAFEVDGRGAFRASPSYWVWGWDAMVHAGVFALTGRAAEVKRMLFFFRDIADPKFGILHSYETDFKVEKSDGDRLGSLGPGGSVTMAPHVQLFYVVLLHDYYCLTGDRATLDALLPFAKTLVDRARAKARPDEALCREYGFFPDNPYAVDQQVDDLSLINNAIYYQGLCAYHDLTGDCADDCARVKRELVERLWDAKEGYWADAYDVHANARRPHYPLYGLFHISPFAQTVRPTDEAKLADYMKRKFLNGSYLAMFAPGTASHLADGNQLGAYYPVADRTYWNAMNAAGRVDALGDFRTILSRHARVLTYPEGQCSDVCNNDPADYSDELGNKQFFSAKSWLADTLELNLGLRWTVDGLSFHALADGQPFVAENLTVRGKRLTVRVTGKGAKASYVLDGQPLADGKVGYGWLKDGSRLEITVTE